MFNGDELEGVRSICMTYAPSSYTHSRKKDMLCFKDPSEKERETIADEKLTKPTAVARCLVKYSGVGARSGKYRSDIPKPTKKPWVKQELPY